MKKQRREQDKEIKKSELILGIDDAGRGPVIGPMALAGCLIIKDMEEELRMLGVRDSKLLTPKKREWLAKKIKEKAISFFVVLTDPKEIDLKIKTGTNLNEIEAIKAAEIINELTREIKEEVKVVIDCPSVNRESWKGDVMKRILKYENLIVSCEHKADRDHVAVGAASILAKSAREEGIEKLKKKIGKDFGSGYPNDPVTKEFLKKYGEEHKKDGIFRETWATWKNRKKEKDQKKIGDF